MSPTRTLARPLLAASFIAGGVDGLRSPAQRVAAAEKAGLDDAAKLVRINAGTQLVAGLGLATGRLPRLSALALAGSLVPSTYVGHPFWSESDKGLRKTQQIHFLKNLAMFGGLVIAAADTGGRESIPHAAGRLSRRTTKQARKQAERASKRAAKVLPG